MLCLLETFHHSLIGALISPIVTNPYLHCFFASFTWNNKVGFQTKQVLSFGPARGSCSLYVSSPFIGGWGEDYRAGPGRTWVSYGGVFTALKSTSNLQGTVAFIRRLHCLEFTFINFFSNVLCDTICFECPEARLVNLSPHQESMGVWLTSQTCNLEN